MRKALFFLSLLCCNACYANIDERIECTVTYYNNVVFDNMPTSNIDNEEHVTSVYFDVDNANKKIYNANKNLIEEAVFTTDTISINWNSTKVPRICILLNKKDKTIKYKSFIRFAPREIGNTGQYTPASTMKTNGHGVCKYKKI